MAEAKRYLSELRRKHEQPGWLLHLRARLLGVKHPKVVFRKPRLVNNHREPSLPHNVQLDVRNNPRNWADQRLLEHWVRNLFLNNYNPPLYHLEWDTEPHLADILALRVYILQVPTYNPMEQQPRQQRILQEPDVCAAAVTFNLPGGAPTHFRHRDAQVHLEDARCACFSPGIYKNKGLLIISTAS